MIDLFYHSIYILFIFFAISSVATGVILAKTRRSEDVLVFIACVVSALALFTSALFGYTSQLTNMEKYYLNQNLCFQYTKPSGFI